MADLTKYDDLDRKVIATILENDSSQRQELGTWVGRLYTDHGFPVDMALDHLPGDADHKTVVLHHALHWLVEHRRNSGATDKAIERQRNANRESIRRFVHSGESGVY